MLWWWMATTSIDPWELAERQGRPGNLLGPGRTAIY